MQDIRICLIARTEIGSIHQSSEYRGHPTQSGEGSGFVKIMRTACALMLPVQQGKQPNPSHINMDGRLRRYQGGPTNVSVRLQ